MQKILRIFVVLYFLTVCQIYALEDLNSFHICTVASQNTAGLDRLLTSCKRHGVHIDVLGLGLPYPGNGQKLVYVQQYIQQFPDDDVVLFVDAYDVLFMTNAQEILNVFFEMNAHFVISAEKNCYPDKSLSFYYPSSPTPFRYINSGSYIGYVSAIKELFGSLKPIQVDTSDQRQITVQYLRDTTRISLDYYCELFCPLTLIKDKEIHINSKRGKVYLKPTHSTPCIVHGNGRGLKLYEKIYREVYEKKKR